LGHENVKVIFSVFLLPHKGAEFDIVETPISAEDKKVYESCSQLFVQMQQSISLAVKLTGCSKAGQINKLYYSLAQRFFLDLLNSFKVGFLSFIPCLHGRILNHRTALW